MISLKLEIDGKQKEFKQKSIKVRAMRELMKFQAKMEKVQSGELELSALEQIDQMIMLVADVFDNPEVNFDTIIDGIEADKLEETLSNVFNEMGGGEAAPAKKVKKTSQK
ncbi:MAG: hypothetical protein [Bacteriophage sp.]|nr:MAG: hypothetical protein [Bacteriophage sp.]UVM91539.1 MAG: hypothetical protein [Bacteriophage sp.]UVN01821.1 MAG: hypothetical protein [Bacteriophage sp.]UVX34513.1 MAG: hypothetical protein [Bacteriophage sp.]UVX36026.1 MAG: hypothetical protein [Bacteriophage sp.]